MPHRRSLPGRSSFLVVSVRLCYKWFSERIAIFKVCVLASGSSGNATLVSTGRTRLLIDAGLSLRDIRQRLEQIGERAEHLNAILISHEHSDHVAGLPRLARKLRLPVYITERTGRAIDWGEAPPLLEHFQAGSRFPIGDIEIASFTVPHDAADPVGFCLRAGGVQFALVTDLGYITDSIRYHLRGSDLLLLESNHDLEMLKVGPYPWSVKQRVMSRLGHLSNDSACDFIREDFDISAGTLILGHLSENNNHPEIVRIMAAQALADRGAATRLVIAQQKKPTEVFTFNESHDSTLYAPCHGAHLE